MTRVSIIILSLMLLCTAGCVVRFPPETVVTLIQDGLPKCSGEEKLAFRSIAWAENKNSNEIVIFGSGLRREYRVYMRCFIYEPYPVMWPRSLRVTLPNGKLEDSTNCEIKISIFPGYLPCEYTRSEWKDIFGENCILTYTGRAKCATKRFFDKITLELADVRLDRVDGKSQQIVLSGKVAAEKCSLEQINSKASGFDRVFSRFCGE